MLFCVFIYLSRSFSFVHYFCCILCFVSSFTVCMWLDRSSKKEVKEEKSEVEAV